MKIYRFLPFLLATSLGCAAQSSGGSGGGPVTAADTATSGAEVTSTADTAVAAVDANTGAQDAAAADAESADGGPADTGTPDVAAVDTAVADAKLPKTWGLQVTPVPVPTFTQVVDSAGQPVSQDDLMGHYTVVWFYPAAQTSG